MLCKTEWSWESQTWSHKMNLLDILWTSPHYYCRKWIGATNENSNFDLIDSWSSLIFLKFFFNCLGCSFYWEDHVQFHIFIRNSRYDLFHIHSLYMCCNLFFISGNCYFPFVSASLGYITNLPKNKRKTKLTRDEKSTATYICSYFEPRTAAAP